MLFNLGLWSLSIYTAPSSTLHILHVLISHKQRDVSSPVLLPGTDATHADHIEKIKSRLYVGLTPDGKFLPGELGMGLVEGTGSHSWLTISVPRFWDACIHWIPTFLAVENNRAKHFKVTFPPITKHFVSRNTLHNLKHDNLRIIMEYTSQKLNVCIISKTKRIKLPNR